jgi:hypothetical protein
MSNRCGIAQLHGLRELEIQIENIENKTPSTVKRPEHSAFHPGVPNSSPSRVKIPAPSALVFEVGKHDGSYA